MHVIEHDGHFYAKHDDIPDLGSWECVSAEGHVRNYQGLSSDVAKLPKYEDLGAGSTAMCLDSGDLYLYHAKSKTWYKQ